MLNLHATSQDLLTESNQITLENKIEILNKYLKKKRTKVIPRWVEIFVRRILAGSSFLPKL